MSPLHRDNRHRHNNNPVPKTYALYTATLAVQLYLNSVLLTERWIFQLFIMRIAEGIERGIKKLINLKKKKEIPMGEDYSHIGLCELSRSAPLACYYMIHYMMRSATSY